VLKYIFVYYPVSFSEIGTEEIRKIDELVNQVRLCLNNDGALRTALMTLTEFLCALPHKTDFSGAETYVNALIKYVRENSAHSIDVGELAYKIGISENYLCYMFLKKIGMSVWEYREQCRFSDAKKILIDTEKSVEEICTECGFDETVNFVRAFTEAEGITPIEYRAAHKG
jgi:transcriptional regulator GlxA family with amidase domain